MNSYVIIHRKGDDAKVERVFADGARVLLSEPPVGKVAGAEGGYWQLSESNGLIGPDAVRRKAEKLDAKLGVPIDYVPVGRGRWKAGFKSKTEKRAWLTAHKRVDFDAGYRDPCPGDFRGQVPQEFE
jgi:hypothetical protein